MAAEQLGSGSGDGVIVGAGAGVGTKLGFYGTTPVVQRASTAAQLSCNLSTALSSGSLGATLQSMFNANALALQEVMATLKAYGLWSTN